MLSDFTAGLVVIIQFILNRATIVGHPSRQFCDTVLQEIGPLIGE